MLNWRLILWVSFACLIFAGCLAVGVTWFIDRQTVVQSLEEPPPQPKQVPADILNAPSVAFCDLVRSPENYTDRLVRVRAVNYAGKEWSALEDSGCLDAKNAVSLRYESEEALTEGQQKLVGVASYPEFQFPKRAEVLVVGKIDCSDKRGYGHLNCCKCEFTVARLEEAKAIPATVPWPL